MVFESGDRSFHKKMEKCRSNKKNRTQERRDEERRREWSLGGGHRGKWELKQGWCCPEDLPDCRSAVSGRAAMDTHHLSSFCKGNTSPGGRREQKVRGDGEGCEDKLRKESQFYCQVYSPSSWPLTAQPHLYLYAFSCSLPSIPDALFSFSTMPRPSKTTTYVKPSPISSGTINCSPSQRALLSEHFEYSPWFILVGGLCIGPTCSVLGVFCASSLVSTTVPGTQYEFRNFFFFFKGACSSVVDLLLLHSIFVTAGPSYRILEELSITMTYPSTGLSGWPVTQAG